MLSKLVDVRIERGMTQSDVADIIGTSQQSISKLESYDANPRLDTLRTYANAIGALIKIEIMKDTGAEAVKDHWETIEQIVKSTSVPSRERHTSIRSIREWSEINTYETTRVGFALGA